MICSLCCCLGWIFSVGLMFVGSIVICFELLGVTRQDDWNTVTTY